MIVIILLYFYLILDIMSITKFAILLHLSQGFWIFGSPYFFPKVNLNKIF